MQHVDELEDRGLVLHSRSARDRRQHSLELTDAGQELMVRLRGVAQADGEDLLSSLDAAERDTLVALLSGWRRSTGCVTACTPASRAEGRRD